MGIDIDNVSLLMHITLLPKYSMRNQIDGKSTFWVLQNMVTTHLHKVGAIIVDIERILILNGS